MSIKVNTAQLEIRSKNAEYIGSQLREKSMQINSIYYSLDSEVKGRQGIDSSMQSLQARLEKVQQEICNINKFLAGTAERYNIMEATIEKRALSIKADSDKGDIVSTGAAVGALAGTQGAQGIETGAVQGEAIGKTETDKTKSVLDILQTILDVVGFIPGLGDAADAVNAAISLMRGDITGALLSSIALVPLIGSAVAVPLKALFKAAGNADEIAGALKLLANIFGGMDKVADEIKAVMASAIDIIKNIPEQLAKIADNGLIKRLLGDNGVEALGAMAAGLSSKIDNVVSKCDEVAETVEKAVKTEGIGKAWKNTGLLDELASSGVKYNPNDVLAITKTGNGKLVWLEVGNSKAGMQHILDHADDFVKKGIQQNQIKDLVMESLTNDKIVGYQGRGAGRPIYEVIFEGKTYHIAITIGDNGFIVGANPTTWL